MPVSLRINIIECNNLQYNLCNYHKSFIALIEIINVKMKIKGLQWS